ncbi:hypothetical protein V5O48_010278 [Marasmius crinis-equi]|uniref:Uncharacterized protein n=1 Tax=Marasmius crinis-equi TaxID=585013 RepID=A0ABR3F8T0_9AGAR
MNASEPHAFSKPFLHKPPHKVDFDHIDSTTAQALSALAKTSASLMRIETSLPTSRLLASNWSQIWPWFRALARGVIDHAQPATAAGFKALAEFLESSSMIVIHPSVGFSINALAPLLRSTPEIFAVTFELWLYASEMDHPSADTLMTSVGVLFDGHSSRDIPSERRVTGRVLVELEKVLKKKKRWDVPAIFMQSLIRGMCTQDNPDYLALWYHVLIPNALIRSTNTLKLSDFNAKDAIRWISKFFEKLFSDQRDVSKFEERDEVIILCATECLHYIEQSVMADAYFFIPALDGGILLSFMKAKDFLADEAMRPSPVPTATLSFHFTLVCNLLLARILHRPIFIRLAHWLKRIDKAQLDRLDNSSFDRSTLKLFRKAWNSLKVEVYRRSSLRGLTENACEYPKVPSTFDQD